MIIILVVIAFVVFSFVVRHFLEPDYPVMTDQEREEWMKTLRKV